MRIGIDLDNTIVSYDDLFRRAAISGRLVPENIPPSKTVIRDFLRRTGREDAWTALQGEVYGRRMLDAQAFPGALKFFHACSHEKIPLFIISHRTQFAVAGEPYDLHAVAREWLRKNGIFEEIPEERTYFELTLEAKLERIKSVECSHFIDDLREFLCAPGFPPQVQRILFNPQNQLPVTGDIVSTASWIEIQRLFAL